MPPPETVLSGSVPQRGIEEMARDAGRSLAARPARGVKWWRKCPGADDAKNFSEAPLGHGWFGVATGGCARWRGLAPG